MEAKAESANHKEHQRLHIQSDPHFQSAPCCRRETKIGDMEANLMMGKDFDNGKKFTGQQEIAELFQAKTYFTTPYTSQEK